MGKCNFKRIGSLLLVGLAAILLCLPASAAETAAPTTCPHCGGDLGALAYTPWNGTVEYTEGDAHYQLTADATLTEYLTVAADTNLVLDLNGFSLSAAEGQQAFLVAEGGRLTILDSSENSTGKLIGSDVRAGTLGCSKNAGTVYIRGTVDLLSGAITGGKANQGGNIYMHTTGVLNLYGGTICDGAVEGDNKYGGNLYVRGTLNIYGGAIENGTSQDHGGNIMLSADGTLRLYDGTISGGITTGGETFGGSGANIYITGATTKLYMYGGAIRDGQNTGGQGGNLYINTGAQCYLYGGVIENGYSNKEGNNVAVGASTTLSDGTKQYSSLYMLGGTIRGGYGCDTDIYRSTGRLYLYNGRLETVGFDVEKFLADCACMNGDATGYTVWHYGQCTDCLFATDALEGGTVYTGTHAYHQAAEKHTFSCDICNNTLYDENAVALVNNTLYESLDEALAATAQADTLALTGDVTVGELSISGITLDLNGNTLTADAFSSAASGNVIDTQGGIGKLVSESISVSENNTYLPVTFEDGLHFCEVDFDQKLERVDDNTTKVKFRFAQSAAETLIDDAIRNGSTELDVQIHLTWTDQNGVKQDKTYLFSKALLQKYAARWDGRVFVTTIGGVDNIKNLTCTYQVTSKAGATVSAVTLKNVAKINELLTWEQINSYPIKRSDMTVDEMRDLVVSFMYFTKTYLWTPDETINYVRNAGGRVDQMYQGQVYGGLPYVGVASGNVYRMMDYIDPATGLLDMEKAIPALATKDTLAMKDLKYFGSQCSISVYWGWGRVMNSAEYMWTYNVVPQNGFVLLGDIQIQDIPRWTPEYNTNVACEENGRDVMFNAYAQALRADGMVYYIESSDGDGAGHLVMVYKDAEVAYNEDGTIDGDNSYLTIIDQGQSWKKTGVSSQGDKFWHKGNIDNRMSFETLYTKGYMPFTYQEFVSGDPIEVTEVSLVGADGTLYADGTVDETTRAFTGTQSGDTLTWTELFSSKIIANYGIADAYIIVTDDHGNELYRHAVRTGTAGNKKLSLAETGANVTTWETKPLFPGRTYHVAIEVQLATGERPTIYAGQLTMDN